MNGIRPLAGRGRNLPRALSGQAKAAATTKREATLPRSPHARRPALPARRAGWAAATAPQPWAMRPAPIPARDRPPPTLDLCAATAEAAAPGTAQPNHARRPSRHKGIGTRRPGPSKPQLLARPGSSLWRTRGGPGTLGVMYAVLGRCSLSCTSPKRIRAKTL